MLTTTLAGAALLAAAAGILIYKTQRGLALKRRLARIKSTWGEEHERERDFATLAEFQQVCLPADPDAGNVIDDQTWRDLNMDTVYARIDRTFTTAGACLLYRILRTPLVS